MARSLKRFRGNDVWMDKTELERVRSGFIILVCHFYEPSSDGIEQALEEVQRRGLQHFHARQGWEVVRYMATADFGPPDPPFSLPKDAGSPVDK